LAISATNVAIAPLSAQVVVIPIGINQEFFLLNLHSMQLMTGIL
jgi:hypothetical protein